MSAESVKEVRFFFFWEGREGVGGLCLKFCVWGAYIDVIVYGNIICCGAEYQIGIKCCQL